MELFHVLNRGVEKRNVVQNDKDRVRFIHDLFAFNNQDHTLNYILPGRHGMVPRMPLVRIHAYCLMPNHYHLLLSPAIDGGISLFMKKLNMGYAKYFNEKYERSGALWQGKYKRIPVQRDAHFLYIPYYIHLNPLDLKYPEWREGKVHNTKKVLQYLEQYRWSSHLDYLGIQNFPSLLDSSPLSYLLDSRERYEREIMQIVQNPDVAHASLQLEN